MDITIDEFEEPENIKSLAMIRSRTVVGVTALPVMVEVHLANGLPNIAHKWFRNVIREVAQEIQAEEAAVKAAN